MLGIGIWCRIDPAGFAEWANWPEHEHFLHDAGVFQIGIGLMMIAPRHPPAGTAHAEFSRHGLEVKP